MRSRADGRKPLDEEALTAATTALRQRGLAASNDATVMWAAFPLSGDCPSRAIDPQAETALLQVTVGTPHPIAGAGYLATISLPLTQAPVDSAEICARLNALELEEIDFRAAARCMGLHTSGDLPGYCFWFIPTAEPMGELHMTLMGWCRQASGLAEGAVLGGEGRSSAGCRASHAI